MTIKEEILALQTGEKYNIPDNTLEIWHIRGSYFLFDLIGNHVKYSGYYENIDKLMEKIKSWTVN